MKLLDRLKEPSSWAGVGLSGLGLSDLLHWWWAYSAHVTGLGGAAAEQVQGGNVVNGALLLVVGLLSIIMKERGVKPYGT